LWIHSLIKLPKFLGKEASLICILVCENRGTIVTEIPICQLRLPSMSRPSLTSVGVVTLPSWRCLAPCSVLRVDFTGDSDVDVLVAFAPGHTPGFVELHHMEQELSELLKGRRLDLVTRKFLNHRIRDAVLAGAEVIYAEG